MAYAQLRQAALFGLLCSAVGCAAQGPLQPTYVVAPKVLTQGGLVRIIDGTGYLSYHTPTPNDVPGYHYVRRARGEVCQNDLQLPLQLRGSHLHHALNGPQTLQLIWGNAAVAAGVEDALSQAPPGAVLYDLTLDLHQTSIFGLFFRRQCLVVSGSLAVPGAAGQRPSPSGAGTTPHPPEATPAPSPVPAPIPNWGGAADSAPALVPPVRAMQVAPAAPKLVPLPQDHRPSHNHPAVRSGHKARHRSRAQGHRGSRGKHPSGKHRSAGNSRSQR